MDTLQGIALSRKELEGVDAGVGGGGGSGVGLGLFSSALAMASRFA